MDNEGWTEFSGVAGRVLARSLSLGNALTGLVLGTFLLVASWVLVLIDGAEAIVPLWFAVVALAMARSALNGMYGEWSGTPLSSVGGSWSAVGFVALRYLALTGAWYLPMALLGQGVARNLEGANGRLDPSGFVDATALGAIFCVLSVLTPPVFLIAAVGTSSFSELFSREPWERLFRGRATDLFAIYVLYTGAQMMVIVLSLPLVMLAVTMGPVPTVVTVALTVASLLGLSVDLLGRLCGFYACGDLRLGEVAIAHEPPRAAAVPEPPPRPAAKAEPAPPAVPIPAAPRDPAGLPVLADAPARVAAARQRAASDSEGALGDLLDLRARFAPHPLVLHALACGLVRAGRTDDAVRVAREAIPLSLAAGHIASALEVFRELRHDTARLELASDTGVQVAGALTEAGDLPAAVRAYSTVLAACPGETRAVRGLLRVAERILHEKGRPDSAAKVYRYLLEHCASSPLVEFMRCGLEEAERALTPPRAARAAPGTGAG